MRQDGLKIMTLACGIAFSGGCASLNSKPAQLAVSPVLEVSHSPSVADPFYQLGRDYHRRGMYDAAIVAYRKALLANPANAEIRNALGVSYASRGQYAQAVSELREALALAPSASHIHNNLGYTYLLAGRTAEAVAALQTAVGLDSGNRRSRDNLELAQQRLGREGKPGAVAMPAEEPAKPESSLPMQVANTTTSLRLEMVAPNIFELRQNEVPSGGMQLAAPAGREPVAAKMTRAPAPRRTNVDNGVAPGAASLRLEVANGNGVTGLARRTSRYLQDKGYAAARLTNQRPYRQAATEIHYRNGQQDQARELNALLREPVRLVESARLKSGIGIRLVLGRDMVQRSVFAEAGDTEPIKLASR